MSIFKDLDSVGKLGSGVPRILENYDKSCFVFSQHFLRMTFTAEKEGDYMFSGGQVGSSVIVPKNYLTPRELEVLANISQKTKNKSMCSCCTTKYQ